ncbi:hypothetical protein [Pseudomonas nitroreducens]|uniref:hypothetical protein n=1 Tax=Pseudomonas nitroreducens TaxID=46680 RepID=UPI00351D4A26
MKRTARSRNSRPTSNDVRGAWQRLRQASEDGDLCATALLVALAENKPLLGIGGCEESGTSRRDQP